MPFLTSQSSNFVEVHSLNTPPDGQRKKKEKIQTFLISEEFIDKLDPHV